MVTWWTRDLYDGLHGRDVAIVQRILGEYVTGDFDPSLTLVVRGFQRGRALTATGVVDEKTADALGEQLGFGLLPVWFTGAPIAPGDPAYSHALDLIGASDENGLRRFQGNHRIPPTGVIDETTARILAGLEVD